jgi:hypothetical protein
MSDRIRYAIVSCPVCVTEIPWSGCIVCAGKGTYRAELIRLDRGSAARGGGRTTKRTTADAKFSKAVREAANWKCSVCQKDFTENPGGLDCMHYIKRGYKALRKGYSAHTGDGCCLRHDLGNALAGCKSCHLRLEGKPEHETHFRDWFGDAHCDALQGQKPKSQKIVARP